MGTEIAVLDERSLALTHRSLLGKRENLIALANKQPRTIKTEAQVAAVSTVIKDVRSAIALFENTRTQEKQPYLDNGRAIDRWFKQLVAPLETALANMIRPIDAWQEKVEEERREQLEREAEARRKEADRLAKAAEKKRASQEVVDSAAHAEVAAQHAEEAAAAPAADLVRTTLDNSVVVTRRTEWRGEIINREQLDLEKLRPHIPAAALQTALNAYVRAGGRELAGAKIAEVKSAVVR